MLLSTVAAGDEVPMNSHLRKWPEMSLELQTSIQGGHYPGQPPCYLRAGSSNLLTTPARVASKGVVAPPLILWYLSPRRGLHVTL